MATELNRLAAEDHHHMAIEAEKEARQLLQLGKRDEALVEAQLATMHATLAAAVTNLELRDARAAADAIQHSRLSDLGDRLDDITNRMPAR
jgi:hypothetical protein